MLAQEDETLFCPHCSDEFTTDVTLKLPDSKTVICRHCRKQYKLGAARRLGEALLPVASLVKAPATLPESPPPEPAHHCRYCTSAIEPNAIKCPHCQEWLNENYRPREPVPKFNGTAAVLSFVIPGLGQVYKGQILNGVTWLAVVVCGYLALIVPGLILHVLCIWGAGRPR